MVYNATAHQNRYNRIRSKMPGITPYRCDASVRVDYRNSGKILGIASHPFTPNEPQESICNHQFATELELHRHKRAALANGTHVAYTCQLTHYNQLGNILCGYTSCNINDVRNHQINSHRQTGSVHTLTQQQLRDRNMID
jgi:hypothetical protein